MRAQLTKFAVALVPMLLAGSGCGDGGSNEPDAQEFPCGHPCGEHETCITRICTPQFYSATYAVRVNSGHFPVTRGNGSAWDLDGPPDLYATVVFGATTLGSSGVITDSVMPTWNASLATTAALTTTDMLRIDVYDEDGATDELVFSCTKPVTEIIGGGRGQPFGYGCQLEASQASGWVGFSLTPQ